MIDKRRNYIEWDYSFEPYEGPCPICGGNEFRYFKAGPHIGHECVKCGNTREFDGTIQWLKQETAAMPRIKQQVKQRDGYVCKICKKVCGPADCDVHHLIPQHIAPQLKFDKENMIVLCKSCHKRIHGHYGSIKEEGNGESI